MENKIYDCVVIGGGQAGLATGYYLRRAQLDFVILDDQPGPGGAWRHMWPALTLFSAHTFSNLPGMPMPSYPGYPPASHVVDYFTKYEQRYELPIIRPVHVDRIEPGQVYVINGKYRARHVVMATGLQPFVPTYPGHFAGQQWHSATYPGPEPFEGSQVAVVGGANSGAQIAADLGLNGVSVQWYTTHPPQYLPEDVDGSVLFQSFRENRKLDGEIVVLPPVKKARDRGLMRAQPMFSRLDEVKADHLIWCTGFRPSKGPARGVEGVQYVGWGGRGEATIMGVAPFAKQVVDRISGT